MKEEPDRQVLKLSDAFETDGGCLECEAIMLNINFGHNRELMEKCRRLEEYALFIATVRMFVEDNTLSLGDAITKAIDECIERGILSDILTEERAEVHMYILETFDKELYEKGLKDDAFEYGKAEGKKEGIEAGKITFCLELIKDGVITIEEAAKRLQTSEENIKELLQK